MYKKLLSFICILLIVMSLASCSLFSKIKSTAYSDEIKGGYTEVLSISGLSFAVPSKAKESAHSDSELTAAIIEYFADGTPSKNKKDFPLFQYYYEVKDSLSYTLVNYSELAVATNPIKTSMTLDDVDNYEEIVDLMSETEISMELLITSKVWIKFSENNTTKILSSCEATIYDEKYCGYISFLQKGDSGVYILLALQPEDAKDTDVSYYIAQTFKFTNENFVSELPRETNDIENGNTTSNPNEIIPQDTPGTVIENSTALEEFKVTIDGKDIMLPCSVNEFKSKLNAEFSSTVDTTAQLKKNTYLLVHFDIGGITVMSRIANLRSDDELSLNDCLVTSLKADKYDIYGYGSNLQITPKVILPQNIIVSSSTKEDVLGAYGLPTEETDNEEASFVYLTYKLTDRQYDHYTKMEIMIEKETNLVYGFDYGNMPLE